MRIQTHTEFTEKQAKNEPFKLKCKEDLKKLLRRKFFEVIESHVKEQIEYDKITLGLDVYEVIEALKEYMQNAEGATMTTNMYFDV